MKFRFLFLFLLYIQSAICEPSTLGVSLPLTGTGAGWGTDIQNTLMFANEKLGNGTLKLIFEDDRCEPKGAVSAANKLTAIDKVKEVYVMCGQSILAAAPIYKRAGVTVITMGTPSKISQLGVFRMSISDAIGAATLAKYIKRNFNSVSILTEETDYPTELWKDFDNQAKLIGLVATNEFYSPGQYDFRSLLTRVKQSKPVALFLNTQSEQSLAAMVKQLHELNFSPKLYGAYIPGSAGFLKTAGAAADDLEFLDFPDAPKLLNNDGQKLYQEFQNKYGVIKGWTFTFPGVFEVFRLVQDANIRKIPLAEYLGSQKFDGIFGSYSFDDHGDLVGPGHVIRTIKNGKTLEVSF